MARIAERYRRYKEELEKTVDYKSAKIAFNIAIRVSDRLKELNLTQKELAKRLGVSKSYISQVLNGKTNMTIETIVKLSNALNLSPIVELSPMESISTIQSQAEFAEASLFTNRYGSATSSASTTEAILDISQCNFPEVAKEYEGYSTPDRVAQSYSRRNDYEPYRNLTTFIKDNFQRI